MPDSAAVVTALKANTRARRPAGCAALLTLATLAFLAGCASRPPAPREGERDGPGANPPANLLAVPDAQPRVEPLRAGGPNKPYEVLGQSYVPLTSDLPLRETGGASWYGRKFHGKPTALGEPYDMYAMTAAHKTMPLPSYARVRNPANGREVVVRVNDRGPFVSGRVIDLSYTAALKLGLLGGVAPVEVQRLTHDEIRSGRWRGAPPAPDDGFVAAAGQPSPGAQPPRAALPPAAAPSPSSLPQPAAGVAAASLPGSIPPPMGRVDPALLLPDDPAPGDPPPSAAAQPRGWWLQLGAFRVRASAVQLQQHLQAQLFDDRSGPGAPLVAVFDDDGLFRVQAGPWPARAQAQAMAEQLRRTTGSTPVLVERR